MTYMAKEEAQGRADQIAAFREELAILEGKDIVLLSNTQKAAVSSYHEEVLSGYSQAFDVDRSRQAKQLSWGLRIASLFGALAMAASVFFLFNQFWGRFDTLVQSCILISAPLLLFATTMIVDSRDESGYYVKLVAMVAFSCLVLNVSLLGKIFNLTPSDNALLVWAAFALLLAYALEIRLLLAVGLLCLIAFMSARMGTWSGIYWLSFGERPEIFLPIGIGIFLVPWLRSQVRHSGFAAIYRVFGLLTTFIPVLILSNWGHASYLDLPNGVIEGGYQLLGFVGSAMAIWLGIRKGYKDVVNTGTTLFVIFLYTKFYDWWWEIMPKYLFFMVIGLSALLFIMVFKRLRRSTNVATTGEAQ